MSDWSKFELDCDDGAGFVLVAGAEGPTAQAWKEITHFARMYSQDGPCKIYRVTRTEVSAASQPAEPVAWAEQPVGYFIEVLPGKYEQAADEYKDDADVIPLYRKPHRPAAEQESDAIACSSCGLTVEQSQWLASRRPVRELSDGEILRIAADHDCGYADGESVKPFDHEDGIYVLRLARAILAKARGEK